MKMTEIRCDICGKAIERWNFIKGPTEGLSFSVDDGKKIRKRKIDVCNHCVTDFKRWRENKS